MNMMMCAVCGRCRFAFCARDFHPPAARVAFEKEESSPTSKTETKGKQSGKTKTSVEEILIYDTCTYDSVFSSVK